MGLSSEPSSPRGKPSFPQPCVSSRWDLMGETAYLEDGFEGGRPGVPLGQLVD